MTETTLSFNDEDWKEISSTLKATLVRLNWVIENDPPNKSRLDNMMMRSARLSRAVLTINEALHFQKVVEPKQEEAKKATKPRKHTLRIVDKE
jgi:hypothetical protein